MPPGGGGTPPPMAALAAARPPGPPPGGGNPASSMIMQMILKVGLNQLQKTLKNLTGEKDGDKKSQAGDMIQKLSAAKAMPQNAMTPSGVGGGIPPSLQGGPPPGILALLAKLAAATQNKGQ